MVGTAAARELRTAPGVRFALATAADDAAIRRLLRENPLPGAPAVTLEREPDYFRGTAIAGATDRAVVAHEGDALRCVGRCTTRDCWINGEVRRTGYLAELRLDQPVRGRWDVLRGGYRFFRQLHEREPADVYFTSIATGNRPARRLLERGAPGLPRYAFLGELCTLILATGGRRIAPAALESAAPEELAAFLQATGPAHQLAPVWTADRLRALARHGLPPEDFAVIRHDGRIVAAAALWDQRAFRQTVIRAYGAPLRHLRPLLNLLARPFGLPRLPAPGGVLAQACLSPCAVAPGAEERLDGLVAAFGRRAAERGLAYLTLALPARHPGLARLRRRFRCRVYPSRLYRVDWPGAPVVAFDDRPLGPELGFL